MQKEIEFSKDELQLIIFKLGNEEYTVPITSVQEIIMPQTPTHLPKSPPWAEGVINLRGRIIPIVDGKKKFQLDNTEYNGNSRIIILDLEQKTIGLIVDEVSEVIHLKTKDIEPTPVTMEEDSDFLWGVGKYQNRLLILINPQKFLTVHETHDLSKLVKTIENIDQAKDTVKSK